MFPMPSSDDLHELFARAKGAAATARSTWIQKAGRPLERRGTGESADPSSSPTWDLDALRGRLVELSARGATATLSAAIELVVLAQQAGEPVGWVTLGHATFYPPDVADSGVDLAALAVVRVHDTTSAGRAAERLLRSGGFGLVVLDFGSVGGGGAVEIPIAHQGRLVTLAQTHDAAVVCITEKQADAASLGSLVSLRAEALRRHAPEHGGYHMALRVLKDKRRGPGFSRTVRLRGPEGM